MNIVTEKTTTDTNTEFKVLYIGDEHPHLKGKIMYIYGYLKRFSGQLAILNYGETILGNGTVLEQRIAVHENDYLKYFN